MARGKTNALKNKNDERHPSLPSDEIPRSHERPNAKGFADVRLANPSESMAPTMGDLCAALEKI